MTFWPQSLSIYISIFLLFFVSLDFFTSCHQADLDGDGHTVSEGDCNDSDSSIYPGSLEICDGKDNDCDGAFDEGAEPDPSITEVLDGNDNDCDGEVDEDFSDDDGDGFSEHEGDCDDSNPSVNPQSGETCDMTDNDCDGEIDEGFDYDGDGYTFCNGDCDDLDEDTNPSAEEICNDVDDNCNGETDEGFDNDGDGYTTCEGDCDDSESLINPASSEVVCDGIDQDCDGEDNYYEIIDLSTADSAFIGENDSSGYALSASGDVNGDGYDDILIGAPYYGYYNNGKVYLLYGPLSGNIDLSNADASIVGEAESDFAGYSLSIAGDVDGDGYDDVLIGTFYIGKAYLLYGPLSGNIDLSNADASIVGEAESDFAGYALSIAGDVDGDGYDDILIGAPNSSENGSYSGKACLFLGPVYGKVDLSDADASFIGEGRSNYAGSSISSAGDVNGDGYNDILVGAPYYQNEIGKAYLFYGPVSGDINLSMADASFLGENYYGDTGATLSGEGDVNGDGYDDILIGAPEWDSRGKVYLMHGPLYGEYNLAYADASFIGDHDWAGTSISSAGDLNLDGYDDILIGASYNSEGGQLSGKVYLLYGPLSGEIYLTDATVTFIGENANDYAGNSLASGDINADGHPDVIIGAMGNDMAYLIYGPFNCDRI